MRHAVESCNVSNGTEGLTCSLSRLPARRLLSATCDLHELRGVAGDYTIHAIRDFASHPRRLIEVPHQDSEAGAMGAADETLRGESPVRRYRRCAQRFCAPDGEQRPREVDPQRDLGIKMAQAPERGEVEGNDCDHWPDAGAIDLFEHFTLNLWIGNDLTLKAVGPLDFHVHQAISVASRRQRLRKGGNLESGVAGPGFRRVPLVKPGARVQAPQGSQRVVAHPPGAGGRSIEPRVVNDHGHAVRREVDVKLDSVRALAQGQLKGSQSILRRLPCRASMADDKRRLGERSSVAVLKRGFEQWF